ncbi:NERD domain-containing protein [Caldichromatium japonicum]|uniref:NERD domain-containing protein n=1 Tax=Caldichromatium japonicum TaxID=2699430 RepID=A0A6G7VCL1_9GAMM|nr:nuclease-related domain-containing protein [Caldichromatium japonicum]QIK37588.1 NERD domain-containing protein [Caldichromatium japonicum]
MWSIPAVLLLLALHFWRRACGRRLAGQRGERLVGRALAGLCPAVLHDLILPLGKGWTQIDHVALTAKGLLVVETKHYRGLILGRADDPHWCQRQGRRRRLFQNPLRQNALHIQAVADLGLGVPVLGLVVFTDAAVFPHGRPAGVSALASLKEDLASWLYDRPSPRLRCAFQRLVQAEERGRVMRRAFRRQQWVQRRWDNDLVAAWTCLIAASLVALGCGLVEVTAAYPTWPLGLFGRWRG